MNDETRHLVQIRPKLYADIKEYCQLNNLKIGWFVNDLLQKSFMTEKYGDSPFTNFKKKIVENTEEIPEPIQEVINEHFDEMLENDEIESVLIKKEDVNVVEMDKPEGFPGWNTNPLPFDIEKPKKEIKPKKRRLK